MTANGGPTTFGDVIGTTGPTIRWGYAVSYCIALVVSGIFSEALVWAVRGGGHLGATLTYGWIFILAYPLLLAVCILAVFRLLRRDLLGAFVAVLLYVTLTLAFDMLREYWRESDQAVPSVTFWTAWMRFFGNYFYLFGMVLAMRGIKRWWLALPLGAAAAEVLMLGFGPLGTWIAAPHFHTPWSAFLARLYHFPYTLLELAFFTGMLWIGREITSALPGRISKRFYLASTVGGLWLVDCNH